MEVKITYFPQRSNIDDLFMSEGEISVVYHKKDKKPEVITEKQLDDDSFESEHYSAFRKIKLNPIPDFVPLNWDNAQIHNRQYI